MTDLSFLRKFTKENPKKMARYIRLYLGEAAKTFSSLQAALQEADWEQLKIHAHSLKPQAELMGLKDLHQTLLQIEEKAKAQEVESIDELVKKAFTEHEAAIPVLESHL